MPPVVSHPANAPLRNASSSSNASFLAAAAAAATVAATLAAGASSSSSSSSGLGFSPCGAADVDVVRAAFAERRRPWISIHCSGGQALRPSHCCPESCPGSQGGRKIPVHGLQYCSTVRTTVGPDLTQNIVIVRLRVSSASAPIFTKSVVSSDYHEQQSKMTQGTVFVKASPGGNAMGKTLFRPRRPPNCSTTKNAIFLL